MNQLQALPMNDWQRRRKKLFSEQGRVGIGKLPSAPWASRRRQDLLELLDRMTPMIEELTRAIEQEGKKQPAVLRVMTHPGVGALTALAFVLVIGTPQQSSSLLRFLLGEAAQAAARCDSDWRRRYVHLAMRRQRSIATVAMAAPIPTTPYLSNTARRALSASAGFGLAPLGFGACISIVP